MNLLLETTRTFVPFFRGNRELPEIDQVVVEYKVPDSTLKRRLKPKPTLKFNYDAQGNVMGGQTEVSSDPFSIVQGMLVKITHLSFEDKKGEHGITNAAELLRAPLQFEPLIEELAEEFSKELDRVVDEKN